MKSLLLSLVLALVATGLLTPNTSEAQDAVTVSVSNLGQAAWNFAVRNGNAGHLPINRFALKVVNPNVPILDQAGPANWDITTTADSLFFSSHGGSSITFGQADSSFFASFDDTLFDQPLLVNWYTYNNNTLVTSGQLYLIPTSYQTLATRDSVGVSATPGNPDPLFNFKVYNRNGFHFAVTAATVEVLNTSAGAIRPSGIQSPAGWVIDSVTTFRAYFHSISGTEIASGKNLDGFKVALRASPSATNYSFVWRLLNNGTLIDRDTLYNIHTTAGSPTFNSNDTVTAVVQSACTFNFRLANYHIANLTPPSRITRFILTSTTPGVTFQSAPTTPPNWGKSISTSGTTLTFQAASNNDAIPSGIVSNQFAANIDNPTSGNFTLHWQTVTGTGTDTATVSSGDLPLTCTQVGNQPDNVSLSTGSSNCCFVLKVDNQHNPPSNVTAVSLSIPNGQGSFTSDVASTLSWTATPKTDKAQSVRFTAPSGEFEATGASQNLNVCVNPVATGAAIPITWTTYDVTGATISTGTVSASCTVVKNQRDSAYVVQLGSDTCGFSIVVLNRRGGGKVVNSVTVKPLDGWQVSGGAGPIGWSTIPDPNHASIQFLGSGGIADGTTQGGFNVGLYAHNMPTNFALEVRTSDGDVAQLDTVSVTCSATDGVAPADMTEAIALSVAPNPLSQTSSIRFNMPYADRVTVTLIDILGRVQEDITSGFMAEGQHTLNLDGRGLAPGSYYLRLETSSTRITRKVVVR